MGCCIYKSKNTNLFRVKIGIVVSYLKVQAKNIKERFEVAVGYKNQAFFIFLIVIQ